MLGFLVMSVFLTLVNLSECKMNPPLEVSVPLLFEGDMALTPRQISFIGPAVNCSDGCHTTSFSNEIIYYLNAFRKEKTMCHRYQQNKKYKTLYGIKTL